MVLSALFITRHTRLYTYIYIDMYTKKKTYTVYTHILLYTRHTPRPAWLHKHQNIVFYGVYIWLIIITTYTSYISIYIYPVTVVVGKLYAESFAIQQGPLLYVYYITYYYIHKHIRYTNVCVCIRSPCRRQPLRLHTHTEQ